LLHFKNYISLQLQVIKKYNLLQVTLLPVTSYYPTLLVTLNGIMAVILRYFSEFGGIWGILHKSG